MMNSVLDMLHVRYSWGAQVEKLRRQICVCGNQEEFEAGSIYFTVLKITPRFLGAHLRSVLVHWFLRLLQHMTINWVT